MAPRSATPPTKEKGYSQIGSDIGYQSRLTADYAEAWQLPKRWETIQKMASDPAVFSALAAMTYPILAATFSVEPADESPDARMYADFVEEALQTMTVDLTRHRQEVLGFVGEGCRIFETIYERREDGKWWLRKLAVRPNNTIREFMVDQTGGPTGILQNAVVTGNPDTSKPETMLEMDRLLAFTYLGDGPSLLGRPATRAMYRPWWLIDNVSRIGALAFERHGVGVPYAKYLGQDDNEASRIDETLMGLHAGEYAYFRYGEDVEEWGFKTAGGTPDTVGFMEYQRRDLFLAVLAQFLTLESGGIGGGALSADQSSFFMLTVRGIAEMIEGYYNRYLIPKMVGYNWSPDKDTLPRIKHGHIDQRSLADWVAAVLGLQQAKIALPQQALEEEALRLLGLSAQNRPDLSMPGEDVQDVNDPNAPEPEAAPLHWQGHDTDIVLVEDLSRHQGGGVDWTEPNRRLDAMVDEIEDALRPLQVIRRNTLANAARGILRRKNTDALATMSVASNEEATAMTAILERVYAYGAATIRAELTRQQVLPAHLSVVPEEEIAGSLFQLSALSIDTAHELAEGTQQAWSAGVVAQLSSGYNRGELVRRMLPSERILATKARAGVAIAFAAGRKDALKANEKILEGVMYTASMDKGTCPECLESDGKIFTLSVAPEVPNPKCHGRRGGNECRCQLVPLADGSFCRTMPVTEWQARQQQYFADLPDDERQALSEYQGSGFYLLNKVLRHGPDSVLPGNDPSTLQIRQSVSRQYKALKAAFEKAPRLDKATTLYRGATWPRAADTGLRRSLEVGSTITDKAFMSTTRSRKAVDEFVAQTRSTSALDKPIKYVIAAPAGTRAIDLESLAQRSGNKHVQGQDETLLDRATRFRVTKIDDDGLTVHVEIIPPDPK